MDLSSREIPVRQGSQQGLQPVPGDILRTRIRDIRQRARFAGGYRLDGPGNCDLPQFYQSVGRY